MDSRVRANEPAFFVSTKKRTRFPAGVVRRRESDVRERSEGNPSAGWQTRELIPAQYAVDSATSRFPIMFFTCR